MEANDVEGVPVSAVLGRSSNRYGSVPDLDDEELASVEELQRQVVLADWGPVLRLPVSERRWDIRPAVNEDGGVDWGAFGSVDFQRTLPEFDKARYKVEKLKDRLKDVLIMLGIVRERLPRQPMARVLKQLRSGVIELEHITDDDMLAVGKLYLRARRLRQEIAELKEASFRKQRQAAERFWARL